jgi:hypothetical protein
MLASRNPEYFAGWLAWQLANVSQPPTLAKLAEIL